MPATILLVEDEPAIQELIAANLMRAGHHVVRASDAETAQPFIATEGGAAGEEDGGNQPEQAKEQAANVSEMGHRQQVTRGAAVDGPQAGNPGTQR